MISYNIELNVYIHNIAKTRQNQNTGYNSFGNFMKCFGRIFRAVCNAFMSSVYTILYQRYCKTLFRIHLFIRRARGICKTDFYTI